MVGLSSNLVLAKTHADSLQHVKNLNLWGQDISDVHILQDMQNVEVLSLSVNRIGSLQFFGHCTKLKELYLRKNEVRDLNELKWLKACQKLKVLWLSENPCASFEHYRLFVIGTLPSLTKVDNEVVTDEERDAAAMLMHQLQHDPESFRDDQPLPGGLTSPKQRTPLAHEPSPIERPPSQPSLPDRQPSFSEMPPSFSERQPSLSERQPSFSERQPSFSQPSYSQQQQPLGRQPSQDFEYHRSHSYVPDQNQHSEPYEPRPQPSYHDSSPRQVYESPPVEKAEPRVQRTSSGAPMMQSPHKPPQPSRQTSSNILYAIMALLKDLDQESLRIVHAEIDNMLDQ
jgi:hypothetical protein